MQQEKDTPTPLRPEHIAGILNNLYDKIDNSGSVELLKQLDEYLNDWKGRTPEKSELWERRCDRIIAIDKDFLVDTNIRLSPENRLEIEADLQKWEIRREDILSAIKYDNAKAARGEVLTLNSAPKRDQPKRITTIKQNQATLAYFRQTVRDGIEVAFRKGEEPKQKVILKAAIKATLERQNIGHEKLRKDIRPATQVELYSKIYREELETKQLYIKHKK